MDNFSDEDINLFCLNYKQNSTTEPLLNSKIPVWVEYLKTKKHYRENGMEEDYFFKRRFQISDDNLLTIHKLIDRIKRGKTLTKSSNTNINGTDGTFGSNMYSTFDENENLEGSQPKFELMNELQSSMNDYQKKMKKHQQKHKWKQSPSQRIWEPEGSIQNEHDRYYTEEQYSTRPQVEFDVQDFARNQMFNMNKTNIIQQLDHMNDILDSNNLLTNDFDTEYKRSVPVINSNKKISFSNHIDTRIGNNQITNAERNQYTGNQEANRLWQDIDLLADKGSTRKSSIENKSSFEHQYQYLDGNYNRVPDPRIIGTSSRTENRSTFKR